MIIAVCYWLPLVTFDLSYDIVFCHYVNTGIKLVIHAMLNSIPCEGYNFHT